MRLKEARNSVVDHLQTVSAWLMIALGNLFFDDMGAIQNLCVFAVQNWF